MWNWILFLQHLSRRTPTSCATTWEPTSASSAWLCTTTRPPTWLTLRQARKHDLGQNCHWQLAYCRARSTRATWQDELPRKQLMHLFNLLRRSRWVITVDIMIISLIMMVFLSSLERVGRCRCRLCKLISTLINCWSNFLIKPFCQHVHSFRVLTSRSLWKLGGLDTEWQNRETPRMDNSLFFSRWLLSAI